jgi:nucleoside triphosphate diphosphatase
VKKPSPIDELLAVMARLRSATGCPWDREQNHMTLRFHAVEEVYELLDAIEAGDDHEMIEELGDLLLQVVFHCQLARERGAFDFDTVCRRIVEKLIHRHPHVFGNKKVRSAEAVLAQWEHLKRAEKKGTKHERPSALDGIPKHLPALLRAEKLVKKARKANLLPDQSHLNSRRTKARLANEIFALAEHAQSRGWSAEALLRTELKRHERALRRRERLK